MDERICRFLAAESGKDIGDVLDKLGSPDMIAGMIKTEISITKAELRPDLRNFTKALLRYR